MLLDGRVGHFRGFLGGAVLSEVGMFAIVAGRIRITVHDDLIQQTKGF